MLIQSTLYLILFTERCTNASARKFKRDVRNCREIGKPFPIVRVDLYNLNGKIYFGEMTFTSLGGLQTFYTQEFLDKVGAMIDLSKYIK